MIPEDRPNETSPAGGFRTSICSGLPEDLLPSWHAKKLGDDEPGVQEERRNCFMATTRASESVTLTYARSYFGWHKRRLGFSTRCVCGL